MHHVATEENKSRLVTRALDGNFSVTHSRLIALISIFFALVTHRGWGPVSWRNVLPSDPGFGPPGHGAVQLDGVALPDGLSAGLDNKLWKVHQAVWVHFLTELCPLVHLRNTRVTPDSDI